jgi:hypothetical protein
MFLLINMNHDGDTYRIFKDIAEAKDAFDESCAEGGSYRVVLLVPYTDGEHFGFGAEGEIFGAEVLFDEVIE